MLPELLPAAAETAAVSARKPPRDRYHGSASPTALGLGMETTSCRGSRRVVVRFPHGRGTTRPGTLGKHPENPPQPSQPLSPSALHHPTPSAPSSAAPHAFPPHQGGLFQHGRSPTHLEGFKEQEKPRVSWEGGRVARAWCPPSSAPHPAAPGDHSHSSSAAGTSPCRLCPASWRPFAAKCYWVSPKTGAWEVAVDNCWRQRSQLVVLESAEEKVKDCRGKAPALPPHRAFLSFAFHKKPLTFPSWLAKRPSPRCRAAFQGETPEK